MAKRILVGLTMLSTILLGGQAWAAKLQLGDNQDVFVDIRLLMQPQMQMSQGLAPDGGWKSDFFIRRLRIIMGGQVHPMVKFFMDTDTPNLGKDGDWTPTMFLQDGYVDFDVDPAFKVAGGLVLLPFSHQNRQSAATLNLLDYHVDLIRFPVGTTRVWRDTGVEARGLLFDNLLDYRMGVFQGLAAKSYSASDVKGWSALSAVPTDIKPSVDSAIASQLAIAQNPSDWPRFTGRVQLNFLDPEDTFFYGGIYFNKKKIFSAGFGFDVIPDIAPTNAAATVTVDVKGKAKTAVSLDNNTYYAVVGDVFVDLPVGDYEVVGQAAVYHYEYGDNLPGTKIGGGGNGFFADAGFRIDKFEPTLAGDWFDGKDDIGNSRAVRIGLNYWIKEHAANVKGEWGFVSPTDDIGDALSVITIQGQVLF